MVGYTKITFTDSYREASALMIGLTPHIPFVKSLATPLPQFNKFVSNLIASSRNVMIPLPLPQQLNNISKEVLQLQPPAKPEKVLTLADAWAMYTRRKEVEIGQNRSQWQMSVIWRYCLLSWEKKQT